MLENSEVLILLDADGGDCNFVVNSFFEDFNIKLKRSDRAYNSEFFLADSNDIFALYEINVHLKRTVKLKMILFKRTLEVEAQILEEFDSPEVKMSKIARFAQNCDDIRMFENFLL